MKKLLNLYLTLKNLDGKDVKLIDNRGIELKEKDANKLSKILARDLMLARSENPMRIFEICQELSKNGKVKLGIPDFDMLEREVRNLKNMGNLTKAQILIAISNARGKNKEEEEEDEDEEEEEEEEEDEEE